MHFDLAPPVHGDQQSEVDRLVSLGATRIALAEVVGPAAGLAIVDELALTGYQPFHAARADLLRRERSGNRALELGLTRLHAAQQLEVDLLPDLVKARRQFLQGDYEEAVFASFRAVEERVREQAKMTASDLGVKLMRQAFRSDGGPLADRAAKAGEQEAVRSLFAGAIGTIKNPSSHRTVNYDDPSLAAEAVLLADLLLRLLDRRTAEAD
jgi:uncharacterized protein (TIGR02391 family)